MARETAGCHPPIFVSFFLSPSQGEVRSGERLILVASVEKRALAPDRSQRNRCRNGVAGLFNFDDGAFDRGTK